MLFRVQPINVKGLLLITCCVFDGLKCCNDCFDAGDCRVGFDFPAVGLKSYTAIM